MNRKFYVVCLLLFISLFALIVVFHGFSSSQTGSGSGSEPGVKKVAPSVKFKTWRIGQSPQFTDTSTDEERFSFITSTQTSCQFSASVGYQGGSIAPNTSPIDPNTVRWTVPSASHEMELVESSVSSNWTGSDPSQLNTGTGFNVVGKLRVPKVVGTRTVEYTDKSGKRRTKQVPDYLFATTCTANDANRANRRPVHRGGTKMSFTLTFTAQTKAGHTVTVSLPLEADDTDQIRQEYVDYGRPIPSRNDSKWTGENTYDFGHYKTMMDVGLGTKQSEWVAEINKLVDEINERENKEIPAFTVGDFVVTSGYRHPHHNFDHAGSTALMSPHMYGYAIDVRGKALAGGRTLDINGDGENTAADRTIMTEAAKATGSREPIIYKTKHVHVDWAPTNWPNISSASVPTFSLPANGTTITVTVACEKAQENSCSVQVSSSSEHSVTCPDSDCGESYWSCNSYDHNMHRLRSCTNNKLPGVMAGRYCFKTWRRCQHTPEEIPNTQDFSASPLCVTDPNGNRFCSENAVITTPSTPTPTPSTPSYHACGIHETSVSGDHSNSSYTCGIHSGYLCQESSDHQVQITGYSGTFYECQPHQTFGCGHTDLTANAYTHRLESCPPNSNGDSCTSGSSYGCSSHTHVYPAPTATCANGHSYDPTNSVDNNRHRTRTCRWCSQTWQKCVSGAPQCLVKTKRKCWAIE